MWGYHDRNLLLRTLLFDFMKECSNNCSVRRRWRWQQTLANKQVSLHHFRTYN